MKPRILPMKPRSLSRLVLLADTRSDGPHRHLGHAQRVLYLGLALAHVFHDEEELLLRREAVVVGVERGDKLHVHETIVGGETLEVVLLPEHGGLSRQGLVVALQSELQRVAVLLHQQVALARELFYLLGLVARHALQFVELRLVALDEELIDGARRPSLVVSVPGVEGGDDGEQHQDDDHDDGYRHHALVVVADPHLLKLRLHGPDVVLRSCAAHAIGELQQAFGRHGRLAPFSLLRPKLHDGLEHQFLRGRVGRYDEGLVPHLRGSAHGSERAEAGVGRTGGRDLERLLQVFARHGRVGLHEEGPEVVHDKRAVFLRDVRQQFHALPQTPGRTVLQSELTVDESHIIIGMGEPVEALRLLRLRDRLLAEAERGPEVTRLLVDERQLLIDLVAEDGVLRLVGDGAGPLQTEHALLEAAVGVEDRALVEERRAEPQFLALFAVVVADAILDAVERDERMVGAIVGLRLEHVVVGRVGRGGEAVQADAVEHRTGRIDAPAVEQLLHGGQLLVVLAARVAGRQEARQQQETI